jgi:hypothetical protein
MNTTLDFSPQEQFTYDFVEWMDNNFVKLGDEYRDVRDQGVPNETIVRWSMKDCLDLFRKTRIPALTAISTNSEHDLVTLAEAVMRKNGFMFQGFQKIHGLLRDSDHVQKKDIEAIIAETMALIS